MRGGSRQSGVTLIEVMTSVAVLSIGLISVASLAMANLRSTAHGHNQSQATILAEELADTMRSNLVAYEDDMFSVNLESSESECVGETLCEYDEQARFDGSQWVEHAAEALPGGVAVICMDSTPDDGTIDEAACDGGGLNTVKLFWTDTRNVDALAEGETTYRHVISLVP